MRTAAVLMLLSLIALAPARAAARTSSSPGGLGKVAVPTKNPSQKALFMRWWRKRTIVPRPGTQTTSRSRSSALKPKKIKHKRHQPKGHKATSTSVRPRPDRSARVGRQMVRPRSHRRSLRHGAGFRARTQSSLRLGRSSLTSLKHQLYRSGRERRIVRSTWRHTVTRRQQRSVNRRLRRSTARKTRQRQQPHRRQRVIVEPTPPSRGSGTPPPPSTLRTLQYALDLMQMSQAAH